MGIGRISSACDTDSRKASIDNLRNAGIATVIATGNNEYCGYVNAPACISSSISVGASTDGDTEWGPSNWHATLQKLFAPGYSVYSSTGSSDSSYENRSGTSMAAPHVAGACALIKQAKPTATVTGILSALQTTGKGIKSFCDYYTTAIPRIQVDKAITLLAGKIIISKPETWQTFPHGYNLSIDWTTQAVLGNVMIHLKKVDLTRTYTVKNSIAYNASPFTYTIPVSVDPGYYFIRIIQDNKYGDSNKFYIGVITVTSPGPGMRFIAGGPIKVAWTSAGIANNVKIVLYKRGGTYIYTLDETEPYNNSPRVYNIPVNAPADTYIVKVVKGKCTGNSGTFTIYH